jgi:hexosaminidase
LRTTAEWAWRKWLGMVLVASAMWAQAGAAQQMSAPSLMPVPASLQVGSGGLAVDANFSVALTGHSEARLDRAIERFYRQLARQTGMALARRNADASKATLLIRTDHASKPVEELGEDESYALEVTPTSAKLTAATPLGTMHGLQTFLQLVDVSPAGFAAPAVTIKDQPRFPWRGLMIDCARHFMPMDVLKRNLDGMEAVKMNVFHWHLSENQGFRAESRKFPKLHGQGSDGLYYTQEQMRELIEYARDRGIRVVPEFDIPGHSTAWFVGHPELASGAGPYEVERRWGIFDPAMDPTNEKVYKVLDELIAEMVKIFPDHFFHIGGDEVNGKQWDANPKIQAFKTEHGLKNNEALQAYFSGRVQKLVTKRGKTVVGWDEVLVPGVPKDIVIQSWRGQASLAKAAKEGYRGLLSNGYYLDLGWSAARHYAGDPLEGDAANLSAEEKQRVLGGESCMWSEYVNAENVDSRIWPRNAAIAERLWSPQSVTDVASMYVRMEAESQRLEWLGLTHHSYYRLMLQRIAGRSAKPEELAALRTLADVVEPVKDYTREKTAPAQPTSATPLRRLVDAVSLESDRGRRFNELVDRYLASRCRQDLPPRELEKMVEQLRSELTIWQGNDLRLNSASFLVAEVAAPSKGLSAVGAAGLSALEALLKGEKISETMAKQQLGLIDWLLTEAFNKQLILIPAAGVKKLVEAARAGGNCSGGQ